MDSAKSTADARSARWTWSVPWTGRPSEVVELELHEDVVLPFEVTDSRYGPGRFTLPAKALNFAVGREDAAATRGPV